MQAYSNDRKESISNMKTKKQMNDEINQKLGYEFIPAWELFTRDELKYAHNKIVKENKKPLLVNNEVYIFVD